jgi:putative addiction module component (TIGR02574 family)
MHSLGRRAWSEGGLEPPVSEDQRAELRRRLEEHRADPDAVVTWADAKQRLTSK